MAQFTHVDDTAQCSNGIRSINRIAAAASIFHNGARHHDNILRRVGQLLNHKVDHLSQAGIFVLEQLGNTKEKRRGLIGRELLPRIEEEGDLGQENAASSRLDRGAVEQSCCSAELA